MDIPKLSLELIDETEMPGALDPAIRTLLCLCFPADAAVFSRTRYWHTSAPHYSLVYREGDEVLGHVGVVVRAIRAGGHEVVVAGIQNLAVAPAQRKTGLGRRLMTAAMEEAARRGLHFGLLFCIPELEHYYSELGWDTLEATATMLGEGGAEEPIPGKNIAMAKILAGQPFPAGHLHLQGPDW